VQEWECLESFRQSLLTNLELSSRDLIRVLDKKTTPCQFKNGFRPTLDDVNSSTKAKINARRKEEDESLSFLFS